MESDEINSRLPFEVLMKWSFKAIAILFLSMVSPSVVFAASIVPDISGQSYPRIAATSEEIAALRNAWKSGGPNRAPLESVVRHADTFLHRPIYFPPRGGQHNQWYQCERCQVSLQETSPGKHVCRKCETVYTGSPYDDVIFAKVHDENLEAAHAAAWAWTITEDAEYAKLAAEILLAYANRYGDYPYHDNRCRTGRAASRSGGRLHEQTLGEASAMAELIAPTFDLIFPCMEVDYAVLNKVRERLILPMLENIDKNRTGKSNWQTWHNAAMLAGGAALDDPKWIGRAIEDPANGFLRQMEISLTDDGMWYENSWSYHAYAMRALVVTAEHARRLRVDLWKHPRLRSAFMLPIDYQMPGGKLPRFGDATSPTVGSFAHLMVPAYRAYKDERMKSYLPARPTFETVKLGLKSSAVKRSMPTVSKVFHSTGHAILRSGSLASVLTFSPYGGFHGHYDKNSFVFYGRGQELGVDPGRAISQAYRLPIHSRWYKASLSHNAVVVDRQSQRPAQGKLVAFRTSEPAATEPFVLATTRAGNAYQGVVHTRTLYQTGRYLLVFDDLSADNERRFDWFYHSTGELKERGVRLNEAEAETDFPGMEYVDHIMTGTTDAAARVVFASGDVKTYVVSDASEGTEVLTGDGPFGSVLRRAPLVRLTRTGKHVRFAVVLEVVTGDEKPVVTGVSHKTVNGCVEITIAKQGREADLITIEAADALK